MTNDPLIQPDEVYQFTYNLSINRNRHHFKTGIDLRRVRSDRLQGLTVRGQFNFDNNNPVGSGSSMADFLLGLPSQSSVGDRAWTIRMRQHRIGVYVQDDWQVSPRLTLNLGLRWEPTTPVHDHSGEVTGFDFVNGKPIPMTAGQQFYPADYKDFAPRISFAFRPFRNDKTVIRGGYGIYYNSTMNLALFRLGSNPPWANINNYYANKDAPLITFNNPFPQGAVGAAPPPNYGALTPDFKVGYSQLRSLHIWRSRSPRITRSNRATWELCAGRRPRGQRERRPSRARCRFSRGARSRPYGVADPSPVRCQELLQRRHGEIHPPLQQGVHGPQFVHVLAQYRPGIFIGSRQSDRRRGLAGLPQSFPARTLRFAPQVRLGDRARSTICRIAAGASWARFWAAGRPARSPPFNRAARLMLRNWAARPG